MASISDHQPVLLPNLRSALSALYSLNPQQNLHQQHGEISAPKAHEFLLQFQTRNVRRKVQSTIKRIRDGAHNAPAGATVPPSLLDKEDVGSTWLCCLTLLASFATSATQSPSHHQPVHFAEALFAAQTLVHRLRRVKMIEAMDVELEPPVLLVVTAEGETPIDGHLLRHRYIHYIQTWQRFYPNSSLGLIFQNYEPRMTAPTIEENEHRIKCEVTILTLTCLLFDLALAFHLHHPSPSSTSMRPLIATLASALAVTTARLRYTPNPDPSPDTEPIATIILHALERVRGTLSSSEAFQSSPFSHSLGDVYQWVLYVSLTVLPDALLAGSGSGGGSHGSISMDPRSYQAVTTEVRTHGMIQVCRALQDPQSHQQIVLFFQLCQEWAKYAPVPSDLLSATIPLIQRTFQSDNPHFDVMEASMGYWIAIMEGGSLTVEQVLASSLLQKSQSSQQPNKKKQSNKSKKRQKEVLQERTTEDHQKEAEMEVQHRNESALYLAKETIHAVRRLASQELHGVQDTHDEVAGEGAVGGIVACANACLLFLVEPASANSVSLLERLNLARFICEGIQELCQSRSRSVRSFAAETLYNLHFIVLKVLSDTQATPFFSNEMANILVHHFYTCSVSLAHGCRYPEDYFVDLATNNDDELENERNDVRDILRTLAGTVTCSQDGATIKSTSLPAVEFASEILSRLVHAFTDPIISEAESKEIARSHLEWVLHAFSALARPLIARAEAYRRATPHSSQEDVTIRMTLTALRTAGQRLAAAFPRASLSEMLPLSRLYDLALASYSPMLAALSGTTFYHEVVSVVGVGIDAAAASLLVIPELVAPSSLRSSRFDVRGAMRSPGGEDHVGCLAIMRMANHNQEMAGIFIRAKSNVAVELCELHERLKVFEQERGRGVLHGRGVLPKSRRILLGVICGLERDTQGEAGASQHLQRMLENCANQISRLSNSGGLTVDLVFQVAEATFDLASFDPAMISSLFESPATAQCLEVLLKLGSFCYYHMSDPSIPFEVIFQWNRLRAALFCLFVSTGNPDLPHPVQNLVVALTQAECDSIVKQCNFGPSSSSAIYREDLICEDVIPAGVFLHAVCQILVKGTSRNLPLATMPNCINVLHQCKGHILNVMLQQCPNPMAKGSFEDPRPIVAEAWLLAVIQLMKGLSVDKLSGGEWTNAVSGLAAETCFVCVQLLLFPSLGKTQEDRANDPGSSVDGPNMLVTLEFFEVFFGLGPSLLHLAADMLIERFPVERSSLQTYTDEPRAGGVAIIVAAIFRAAQGALPPWAVECMPGIFSSLYNGALNGDLEAFTHVIHMSMSVRRSLDDSVFCGSVGPGSLFSGRFFDTMGEKAKTTFLHELVETAKSNSPACWKRLKSTIKQACGGKKKETDFRQRPGLTKLEGLDRV